MAWIVITPYGSSGDLNLFLALGLGLRARGHTGLFAVEERFHTVLTQAGFVTYHLTGDLETSLALSGQQMFGRFTPFASVRTIVDQYIVPTLRPKVTELLDACAGAGLLIAAAGQLTASLIADLTGIRWATIVLTPGTIPSAYLEPQPLPFPMAAVVRPLVNRMGWAMDMSVLRRVADTPVNRLRGEYGLPPRHDLLFSGNLSHTLTVVAASPAFQPPLPDWPPYIRVTGFCFWDTPALWREPADLTAFLDGPEPVIAVSSGSLAPEVNHAFADFYQTVSGPSGASAPALVVPWGSDQYLNAAQVAHLGAGRWLQRLFYTTERAVHGLDLLLHEAWYRERAQTLATQIAKEDALEAILRRERAR